MPSDCSASIQTLYVTLRLLSLCVTRILVLEMKAKRVCNLEKSTVNTGVQGTFVGLHY